MSCVVTALDVAISGIRMRCFSPSTASGTPSGEQWINKATCWISWCRADAIREPKSQFFRKLLKGLKYVPRVIRTSKLASYAAAKWEILPGVEHRQHKGLNHRAENSHQSTRQRERTMRRFKSSLACATVSFCFWSYLHSFSATTAPAERGGVSCDHARPMGVHIHPVRIRVQAIQLYS
jgi:hypothetical protein